MLRKRVALSLTLAAGLLGSLALVSPAQANHSWSTYHWARTVNPFTLQIGNNTSGTTWPVHFQTSLTDWDASTVMTLPRDIAGGSNKRCSAVAGTVQVCNGTYGQNGWLGLAQIWASGGHISQGTAKMNDTYFNMVRYNNPNEKLHVMCQEIGHTFGLGHTSEDGSSQNTCMDYFSNTGDNATSTLSTKPNQHDFDLLASKYAHLDGTSTLASTATGTGSRNEVGNDRSTWGQEIERGAGGAYSIFERDFGNGEKVLTRVTWANESDSFGPSRRSN